MNNQTELGLLDEYDREKIPSPNSVVYRLLLILIDGKPRSRSELEVAINGTVNNAVTRLRGEFHWLIHYEQGYWWIDQKHLPIDGKTCIKANRQASAQAYKLYADKSEEQAKHGRIREPKARQEAIQAEEILREVFAA